MKLLAPLRVLISPPAIAAVNLVILWPLVLSVVDVVEGIWIHRDFNEAVDTVSTIAIILIGWGVALEERHKLREVFSLLGENETREERIDEICHRFGLGQLLFGLFAEIMVEAVRIPDAIINTAGIEKSVLTAASALLAVGALLLLKQIVLLVRA